MIKVTYIGHAGVSRTVAVPVGTNLMAAAVLNGIEGIEGECGGVIACGTCRVFLDPAWFAATEPMSNFEREMLEVTDDLSGHCRLACQIVADDKLDGLVLRMPATQR